VTNALPPGYHDVDLVKENGTHIFYFIGDSLYTRQPDALKHQDARSLLLDRKHGRFPQPNCVATELAQIVSTRHVIEAICQWWWANRLPFAIFDVGSHVGRFAIEIGNYVRYCQRHVPIIAFEPGRTCDLIRYSVEVNGLSSLIDVKNVALSDVDGPLLFGEADTESNASSLVRKEYHSRTSVVRSVSLEAAMAWVPGIDHVIMKLDVEGAEPPILADLARLRSRCTAIVICEIAPWRFKGWAGATDYLRQLSEQYHLINIHSFLYNYELKLIADDDIGPLMQEVSNRRGKFTDLLLIPRELEKAAELVAAIGRLRN
jgi:FkbM family methyltransferase